MRYILAKGFKSINGQIEIINSDSLCYLVRSNSKGAIGIRTISKSLLDEYVNYFEKHPSNSADQARNDLAGQSLIDKFEYGYSSTLTTMARMVLGEQLSPQDKAISYMLSSPTKQNHLPLQLIFYGAPGTGKSYTIDQTTNEDNSIRTTFHPDSDYASFVGAYKPTMAPMPVNAFVGTTVHHAKNADNEKVYERKIVYKYVPQAFLKAYVKAWERLANGIDDPFYLVIEEINRGNCAQIFGDLFQLLDRNNMGCSSYAVSSDEDIAQFLREDENGFAKLSEEQRCAIRNFILKKDNGAEEHIGETILNGSKLLLPPNLCIWATMNTSDQSLFPIDSAFKRRWNWKFMPIDYNPIDKKSLKPIKWKFQIGNKLYSWGEFLSIINPEIYSLTESSDKQMGYFFAKANPITGIISEEVFLNKVLFYLWTDVFKDFDVSSQLFKNKKADRTFRFTDFFEDSEAIEGLIANFNLAELGEVSIDDSDVTFDSANDADLNYNSSRNQRDYSRYSVNGQGRYNKSDAVVTAIKAFVASLPNLSANKILDKIKRFNLSNTLAYSAEDYQNFLNNSNDPRFAKRYARIDTGNGECIYVYRGSTPERIGELMSGLNNSGTGVTLTKVE